MSLSNPPGPWSASVHRADWADRYSAVVRDNLSQRYPYAAHHATRDDDDRALPAELHPAFATSYDWHSCVHMHWLGARLLAFGIDASNALALESLLVGTLSAPNLLVEATYFSHNPHFERPYGWAWTLRLAAEVAHSPVPNIRALGDNFRPLVDVIGRLAVEWLSKRPDPIRHGVHSNSAFGLAGMLGAARILGLSALAAQCETSARLWFQNDRGWPVEWERSGQDFLSPALAEADLLRSVLAPVEFSAWSTAFLSELTAASSLLQPARVADESDAQQVHLFGLNLSRAAAATRIADALSPRGESASTVSDAAVSASAAPDTAAPGTAGRRLAGLLRSSVPPLLAAGLPASISQEFYSTHWLASFAWDAMEALELPVA